MGLTSEPGLLVGLRAGVLESLSCPGGGRERQREMERWKQVLAGSSGSLGALSCAGLLGAVASEQAEAPACQGGHLSSTCCGPSGPSQPKCCGARGDLLRPGNLGHEELGQCHCWDNDVNEMTHEPAPL